jgi:membrane protein
MQMVRANMPFVASCWSLVRETVASWSGHNGARLGAALAYYSVFSLAPLILITTAAAGLVFGQDAVRGEISAQIRSVLGNAGANAVETMLAGASRPLQGLWATLIGTAILLFAALGVVVQLKDALNTIWNVEARKQSGLWSYTRSYAVSLAAILGLGFLLLVSLVFTAALAAIGHLVSPNLPEVSAQVAASFVSFGFVTIVFAMMFKWLPDAYVPWKDVWVGAVLTAILFEIGKTLIGLYIGKEALESTYGAAASFIALLIWVYYTAQIVLFGAEFTRVYASRRSADVPRS